MLRYSWFRRIICLILVFCFAFCTFGQIKARADAGAGALLWQLGTAVGITPETAIACILVLLGVAVVAGSSDDFWALVRDISADIGDLLTIEYKFDNGVGTDLVEAWLYENTYYFPQSTIQAVHDYLLEDTVTYDAVTDSLVHSGYVYNGWTTTFGEGTLDRVLTWLYCNYPDEYEFANSYEKCTALHYADSTWRYIFSNDSILYVDFNGEYYYQYPNEFVAVHVNADGSFALVTDGYGIAVTAVEEGLYYFKSRIPIDTSNLARDLSGYPGLRIVETSNPDQNPDMDATSILIAVSLLHDETDIEELTQEQAQSGEIAEPDVVVDLETGEVIDANGDTADSVFGQHVVVDAETAIASILISLGVSPGTSNADFRQLITDIITALPAEYIFNFESAAFGNLTLLNAWLYNDIYYFSQDIMEFVNDYIWGNTTYSDGIFSSSATSYEVTEVASKTLSFTSTTKYSIWDNVYFANFPFADFETFANSIDGIIINDTLYPVETQYHSSWAEYYIGSPYWLNGSGDNSFPFLFRDYTSSFMKVYVNNSYTSPVTFKFVALEEVVTFGALIDVVLNTISSLLTDFSFDILTVTENGSDLTYYPVKLFPTLDDAELATQTEVQTDFATSIPAIVVNPDTRVIIEVNIPGSEEIPDPDPTTPEIPDPGVDPDVTSPTTPGTEIDPDPGGGDSGGSGSGSEDIGEGTGAITEDGLWAVLVRFGEWLVNLLWSPFRWLGNMLLKGIWPFFEWLGSVLISGIRTIIEWLANALLTGIEAIFVPSQDFLTNKVDVLCEEFVFAYAIMETAELIRDSLAGLGTSPPVVYINLGAATGSYYYGSTVPFIDMRWYAAFKPVGDMLLSALLWICFCWRVFVKLPGIISGVSGQFSYMANSDDRVTRQ